MLDVGFWELLVIAVVLLLVMGPERLPEVAKQAAFLIRKARQSMYRLRNEMKSELDDSPLADIQKAQREMSDFKNDLKQMGRDLADAHAETDEDTTTSTKIVQTDQKDQTDQIRSVGDRPIEEYSEKYSEQSSIAKPTSGKS